MRKSRFIPISLLSLETSLTVFLRPVTERRYDVHPKLMFYVNYISTEKKEGGHQWTHTSLNCDFLQGLTVSGSKLRLVLVTSHTLLQPFQPIVFSELKAAWQSLLVAQCGDKGGQGREKSTPPILRSVFYPTQVKWGFPPHLPYPPPVLTSSPHIQGPILGLLNLEGRKKHQRETGIANKSFT